MTDSRATGEPVPLGPEADVILSGFELTLDEPLGTVQTVRFEIDDYLMNQILWGYTRIRCDRCDRDKIDEEQHCWLWIENHILTSHGHELPREHPLSRRTLSQKLFDWLDDGIEAMDL